MTGQASDPLEIEQPKKQVLRRRYSGCRRRLSLSGKASDLAPLINLVWCVRASVPNQLNSILPPHPHPVNRACGPSHWPALRSSLALYGSTTLDRLNAARLNIESANPDSGAARPTACCGLPLSFLHE